ncbi:3-oxoacyl-[acyl-carrier-protein] synthase II [Desulfosarcina sp. BuS5]|uniref:beta-ketoacyl-[acyl-carrier-protein] synthase family protein n=1 Tax=Desulfosarcina sp. BuS5 TaxID=933262 RepID=UPI000AEBFF65|nr:beta-ketoacyl-[acyl-carrier-protein] synthase family protein [Desulfosarcina sp. BuS5]WDN87488.1 3-oxoacyl-[acyl-carrier-protein] synthase II [Desulfosarcina sp. BuS5]
MINRVVISGLGAVSPLGHDVPSFIKGIRAGKSAVRQMAGWDKYIGLRSRVGAASVLTGEKKIPRKSRRSMSRMSIFAVQAAQEALADAGLDTVICSTGRVACIIGSTMGGAESLNETFEIMLPDKDLSRLTAMKFFQCVSHTAAMNVAQYLGVTGCVMATSAACASSLQAIGTGYDLIRLGRQDMALCGGAEELHPTVTGSFDILFATSISYNDAPQSTPRPFDEKRDGLVCGDGSGIVILEEYEHAEKRGAKIYGEIIGYHTCGNGSHVSQSDRISMQACLTEALADAGISPGDIDYINAHATATLHGDKEEAAAIREIFGRSVPVSSLKGYIGHTLGASGALELIASISMMEEGVIYPTLNLETVSPECQGICHVMEPFKKDIRILAKNCFAFGGINAVLVLRNGKYSNDQ